MSSDGKKKSRRVKTHDITLLQKLGSRMNPLAMQKIDTLIDFYNNFTFKYVGNTNTILSTTFNVQHS